MAAGDELIDHFDQVLLKNRVVDGPVEIMFAGCAHIWQSGETRSITRAYVPHFLKGATILEDPTRINPPIETLVAVDLTGEPTMAGASTDPLTAAEVAEIKRYGILDESNLPADRYIDDETGKPQNRRELLRVTRGFEPVRRRLAPDPLGPVADRIADSLVSS